MAQIKHRPFNADRFLDKFRGNEAALTAYLGLWDGLIPGLPEPFEVDAFKNFRKTPPMNAVPSRRWSKASTKAGKPAMKP